MRDCAVIEPVPHQIISANCRHRPRRHRLRISVCLSLLGFAASALPVELHPAPGTIIGKTALADGFENHGLEVMTFNQSLGADLTSFLGASADDLDAAFLNLLETLVATDFPARAQRQAALIARRLPDLVALQEVWDLGCVDEAPAGAGCEHPSIAAAFVDHLEVTMDALAALGVEYEAIAIVRNLDLTTARLRIADGTTIPLGGIPFEIDGVTARLTSSDRDVILARTDTVFDAVPVSFPDEACLESVDGCNYHTVVPVQLQTPLGVLELTFQRGFVAVDAVVHGRDYRLVNTHLEIHEPAPGDPVSRFFQAAQAAELLDTLELTTPPGTLLLVLGDMNSSPTHEPVPGPLPLPVPFDAGIVPPYRQFIDAGYTDAWLLRPGVHPGFTCCQAEDLSNRRSELDERIDMIFSIQSPTMVKQIRVVGDRVSDKTLPPGPRLWPSDHAGVAAELLF